MRNVGRALIYHHDLTTRRIHFKVLKGDSHIVWRCDLIFMPLVITNWWSDSHSNEGRDGRQVEDDGGLPGDMIGGPDVAVGGRPVHFC